MARMWKKRYFHWELAAHNTDDFAQEVGDEKLDFYGQKAVYLFYQHSEFLNQRSGHRAGSMFLLTGSALFRYNPQSRW